MVESSRTTQPGPSRSGPDRLWPILGLAALPIFAALLLAACGGDSESDPAAPEPQESQLSLLAAYGERVDAVSSELGVKVSTEELGNGGISISECFTADQAAIDQIAEAIGAESAALAFDSFLIGDGEAGSLGCSIEATVPGAGDPEIIRLTSGPVGELSTEREARLSIAGSDEIEGAAPGLDAESVLAIRAPAFDRYSWIADGFEVGVIFDPDSSIEQEQQFAGLAGAVEGVRATLQGDFDAGSITGERISSEAPAEAPEPEADPSAGGSGSEG